MTTFEPWLAVDPSNWGKPPVEDDDAADAANVAVSDPAGELVGSSAHRLSWGVGTCCHRVLERRVGVAQAAGFQATPARERGVVSRPLRAVVDPSPGPLGPDPAS